MKLNSILLGLILVVVFVLLIVVWVYSARACKHLKKIADSRHLKKSADSKEGLSSNPVKGAAIGDSLRFKQMRSGLGEGVSPSWSPNGGIEGMQKSPLTESMASGDELLGTAMEEQYFSSLSSDEKNAYLCLNREDRKAMLESMLKQDSQPEGLSGNLDEDSLQKLL